MFEIRQLLRQGKSYFREINNWNDIFFLVTFIATVSSDFAYGTMAEDSADYQTTLILYAVLLLTSFIKQLNNLRIRNDISFIARMLGTVMLKLTPFLFLFLSMIIVFMFIQITLGLHFHGDGDNAAYASGIGPMAYFLFLVRTSLGDFEVEQYADLPLLSQYFIWVFWLVIVFANTIIFLNFLIAVITDVYEQIMDTRTEEIFLKKAELLLEIIEVAGTGGIESNIATILISRSKKKTKQENEWNGFFSELKQHMSSKCGELTQHAEKNQVGTLKIIEETHKETSSAIRKLQARVDEMARKLEDVPLFDALAATSEGKSG